MGKHEHEHDLEHDHNAVYVNFGIVSLAYFVLIVPFTAYQLKQFWDYRFKPIIKKRKPLLNTIYIASLLITATTIRPALLTATALGYEIHEFAMTLRVGCLFISSYIFSFRTYTIMYDFNYNLAIFKKRCLAAVVSRDYNYQNWWLSHKQTFGNTKFMSPFVICYLLIMGFTAFILSLLNLYWCKMFVFANFIIAIFAYLFMSKYIIAHRDQFFVKKEIIYTACVWALLIIIYCFLFFIPYSSYSWMIYITNDKRDLILYIIETICTTILMLISTWWINRKCIITNKVSSSEFKHLHNIQHTKKKLDLNGTGTNDYLAMDKTLSHFQGYSLFMEYLLEELSLENLMFITEIVHLKHLYQKLLKKRKKFAKKLSINKSSNTLKVSSRRKSSNKSLESSQSAEVVDDNKSDYETDNEMESENENDESKNENEESKSGNNNNKIPEFHDTPTDVDNHTNNDWKIIKKKYVLNPQDEYLPFIAKSIYKSAIMKQPHFFKKIQMIFEKYILSSAEYEINLKYNHRNKLINIYKEKYATMESEIDSTHSSHKIPDTPTSPSLSYVVNGELQPSPFKLTSIHEKKEATAPDKLNNEQYVMLNNDITIQDINIFSDSVKSIMQLLRGSYIEFCKTKEYQQFAQAYKGAVSLDIFTALKSQSNVCCTCCNCF